MERHGARKLHYGIYDGEAKRGRAIGASRPSIAACLDP